VDCQAELKLDTICHIDQCKSTCRSCDSPRSYLRVPLTRRAVAFMTRCSLSVTDLGALANTVLQKSTRVVTKAWTIVFMDSSSKDRRTRRSWRSQKKDCAQTVSRLRSHEKVMPSTRTWSDAVTVSESYCRDRPMLPSNDWLYVEPAQRSSVLSGFSLRRFADVQ